jgi:hypothetical protein
MKMHPHFHLSYGILVRKYKNVTITLQKERENPLNISFCFQTGDKNSIDKTYVSCGDILGGIYSTIKQMKT